MPTPWPQPRPLITHFASAPEGQARTASAATQAASPTATLVLPFGAIHLRPREPYARPRSRFDRRRPLPSLRTLRVYPFTAGVLSARSPDWRFAHEHRDAGADRRRPGREAPL